MTTTTAPAPTQGEERRALVQRSAKAFYRRKVVYSYLYLGLLLLALAAAFVPLYSIIETVVARGAHYLTWSFLTTDQSSAITLVFHRNDVGGVANLIVGTIVVFGFGALLAIPISMVLAVALTESSGRTMGGLRSLLEVMIGMPSILFGIFIYAEVVQPNFWHRGYKFQGAAGSLAIAVLMVPLMTIACEQALRAVPATLPEAALALGAKKSTVMRLVTFRYALPRMWTGIMLSMSRAVGETAPVLFVIGVPGTGRSDWNPFAPQSTIAAGIFNNFGGSSILPSVTREIWGMALLLIIAVFVFNLASRIIVARANRGRT